MSLSPAISALAIFDPPLSAEGILFKKTTLNFSPADSQKLNEYWNQALILKQQELREKEIVATIENYGRGQEQMLNALFVNGRAVMWPGNAVTLRGWNYDGEKLQMEISELSYAFTGALSNPGFRKAIGDRSLINLRPPFAICTFAITTDNYLVLTVRGMGTNVYPGRYYGQGGNPTSCDFDLAQHQLEETTDELNIADTDINLGSLQFSGIAEDREAFPGKPDLIGWVRLNIDAKTLQTKFEERPVSDRPPDAAGLHLVSLRGNSLTDFLQNEVTANEFCPPAWCGLHISF